MLENTMFKLEFTCKYILFRSFDTNFTIFDAKILNIPEEYKKGIKNVVIKGVFDRIEENDSFSCFARWVEDKKYGMQIEAFAPVMVASSDIAGIKRFLRRFIKGIGKASAEKIVDKYGVNTINKIMESPDNLSCIKGISEEKARLIHKKVCQNRAIEKFSLFLFNVGITNFGDIVKIYEAMGEDAENKIRANPYSICDYLSISNFPMADTVALKLGVDPCGILRISKVIQYYLYSHCFMSGDMYIYKNYLFKTISSFMKRNNIVTFDNLDFDFYESALDYMQSLNLIVVDGSLTDEEVIYLKSLYVVEYNSSELIKEINTRRITPLDQSAYDVFFEEYRKNTGIEPDDIQMLAVKTAYENRFSVLTGGPGTGKTQTVNTIISFIESENPEANIVLCAPTGRASKRMSELTGRESYTIHRLLGIINSDDIDADYELDADFVIVDEMSMTGSSLFYKLLSAVAKNKNTSLLLVGDKDQLPPVDAGMPFKDIIESGKVPVVILEKLFRQASQSQINKNAKMILNGVTQIGENGLTFEKSMQDFFFFETEDIEFQKTIIINSIKQLMDIGTRFEDIMVLSPTRKSLLGVEELNKTIQNIYNPHTGKDELKGPVYNLRVDDRVMQTYNDYDLNVYNGDIGTISSIDLENDEIIVVYDDSFFENGVLVSRKKEVSYTTLTAKTLELAYASTVHKSQGSEYPVIIMPVSGMFYNLSRNILYTAVTRAKKRCILTGSRKALIDGIMKNDNIQRRTLLKERI